ncbi:MBL fold metallo-hydrolase [Pontibaca salina]|uniref:MBL fold metallo-hydrolase n=1 Tax=Pontibaca salina TaxID=2795731 RepID=A0A934HNF4_9RHOB|nr:MBL fold metallo-hydrolase [Pontibaca salina]MBI6628597.1 MBL fold metallo-hydrolase [Pontibaca salina]
MTRQSLRLSRRAALTGAAALPLASLTGTARASADMQGVGLAPWTRVKLGEFEVTTLLAGTRSADDPQAVFGLNVSDTEFAKVSKAANIPADKSQFFFTPTLVNTGTELILFDTGLNADGTTAALSAAGYAPEQVDKVVLTHMHPDHIGGLMRSGAPTYENADYVTGAVEFNAWDMSGDETFEAQMRPLAEQTEFVEDGASIASGITAMAAFGHTPGHMAFLLDSGDKQLLIGADFTNHYVWSLAHPDWEVRFDRDKAMAAKTRRRLLDMLAAERMPFIGYHMPWPGIGYVETRNKAFHYVPHSYQLLL